MTPAQTLNELLADTPAAAIVATLESRPSPPPLAPSAPWRADFGLSDLVPAALFGERPVVDTAAAAAVHSGLLLWNDELDASHTVSQGLPDATGSYWHGIMHRREPDFSNSKYWFRKVDAHPVFAELLPVACAHAAAAAEPTWAAALADCWDPFDFVDRCESAVRGAAEPGLEQALLATQLDEIRLLLAYCARRALG
jgi:hypothetical protein